MVSTEQLERTCHRYHWAAKHSEGMDVLEIACGSGPGLGLLQSAARSLVAGDISPSLVSLARKNYDDAIDVKVIDAGALDFEPCSFDRVILFEALYYLPEVRKFFSEARRVLRPGGFLLLTTANKDLFDFTPSPYSMTYLGADELARELAIAGFTVELAGLHSTRSSAARQRVLRPLKMIASRLGLIPKTMHGKEFLKRLFYGSVTPMPARIDHLPYSYSPPTPIASDRPDTEYKIIYCCARSN